MQKQLQIYLPTAPHMHLTYDQVSTLCPFLFSHGYLCSHKGIFADLSHLFSNADLQLPARAQVTSQPGSSPQEFVLRPAGRSGATIDEMESPDKQLDNPRESPPQVGEEKDIAASESFPKITSPPAPPPDPASSPAPVAEPTHTVGILGTCGLDI